MSAEIITGRKATDLPDWLSGTEPHKSYPELQEETSYGLVMNDPDDISPAEWVDLTREEFIRLKTLLGESRGLLRPRKVDTRNRGEQGGAAT